MRWRLFRLRRQVNRRDAQHDGQIIRAVLAAADRHVGHANGDLGGLQPVEESPDLTHATGAVGAEGDLVEVALLFGALALDAPTREPRLLRPLPGRVE